MDIKHAAHAHWRDRISSGEFPESASRITPRDELVLDALEEIVGLLTPSTKPPVLLTRSVAEHLNETAPRLLRELLLDGAAVEESSTPLVVNPDADRVGYEPNRNSSLPYAHGYRMGWNAAIDKLLGDISVSLPVGAIEHLGLMRRD